MARPLKPLVHSGGWYPSKKWIPLVRNGGYTTQNGGEQPEPEAVLKTVTGSLIHITDALALPAEALTVNVEPIQDLHGYDNPWPAGGGKNLLPTQTTVKSGGTYFIGDSTTYFPFKAGTYTASHIGTPAYMYWQKDGTTDNNIIHTQTNSGTFTLTEDCNVRFWFYTNVADASFTDIQIESGSTATAWTPYSNICPISGHTDADVTRTGKNLANVTPTLDSNRYVTFFGNHSASDATTGIFLKAGTYTLSVANPQGANVGVYGCYLDDHAQITISGNGTQITKTGTLTLSKDRTLNFWLYFDTVGTNYTDGITVQLELGSTATDYEEYRGTTYPIPLGTTVYGGQLDVLTGVLTVEYVKKTVTEFSGAWGMQPSGNYAVYVALPDTTHIQDDMKILMMRSNIFKYTQLSRPNAPLYGYGGNDGGNTTQTFILPSTITSLAEANAWLANNPTECTFKLATPIVYDLTPTEVRTLLGTNNIWADTGDVTVTYLADGNASDIEALNILLGGRYVNNHGEDEPTDREALDILLGR